MLDLNLIINDAKKFGYPYIFICMYNYDIYPVYYKTANYVPYFGEEIIISFSLDLDTIEVINDKQRIC